MTHINFSYFLFPYLCTFFQRHIYSDNDTTGKFKEKTYQTGGSHFYRNASHHDAWCCRHLYAEPIFGQ